MRIALVICCGEFRGGLKRLEATMMAFLLFIVLVLLAFLGLTGPDSFVRWNRRR
jgi:hypothetical protein